MLRSAWVPQGCPDCKYVLHALDHPVLTEHRIPVSIWWKARKDAMGKHDSHGRGGGRGDDEMVVSNLIRGKNIFTIDWEDSME
jgi:hypothetical protein